ncbi:hypothetical protein SH2C18_29350 [Clostridium sediminicola]|uniref:hypothetical protein n=1 Tax=Clostridium sediminicola TaxID=3114879 RepID=UPI0031F24A69
MKNFRKFIIPGTVALTILGSTTAFAVSSTTTTDTGNETTTQVTMEHRDGRGGKGGFKNREDKEAKRLERQEAEAAILEKSESLIPGATAEFEALKTKLDSTRETLHQEMDALREKVQNGEITREKMKETLVGKIGRRGHGPKGLNADGTKTERPANPWDELESAVEADDATAAQTAFDSIIEHMTEHLTEINERLSALQ